MKFKQFYKLFFAIIICQLVGFAGSFFTMQSVNGWYKHLEAPNIAPPNWIFGPVWTILFVLMGVALYFVLTKHVFFKKKKKYIRLAVLVFYLQLAANLLWSTIFFGLRNPGLAFAEILLLWVLILVTIIYFYKIDKRAAYLMIPYIVWVSFAAILNYSFWLLN